MSKDYDYGEIIAAKYMELSIVPISEASIHFCELVSDQITSQEKRKRARKSKDLVSFQLAIRLILGDLLIARAKSDNGWLFRSRSKKNFHNSNIKGDTFNKIIDSLVLLNYVNTINGVNFKNPFATNNKNRFYSGYASRFKATDDLLKLWTSLGHEIPDLKLHFKLKPKLNDVRLKGTSSRYQSKKIKGKALKVEDTITTRSIRDRLFQINEYLVNQSYKGTEFYGLHRLFNEGDNPNFKWNMGGRLYGIGEGNYQLFKKDLRTKIKINGEEVLELDINASFLRILHSLRGFNIPDAEDIYAIEGIDRRIVKSWISSTLGHTGFHRAWPLRSLEEFKKANIQKPKKLTYPLVMEKVIEHLPVLNDWPQCGVRWSNLMFEESEAMISTMEALREIDVVALPVHDSLIIPHSKAVVAHDILKETFEKRFGVNFVIKGL